MKASRLQTFGMLSFPHALPAIFAGFKVSVTLAVVGAVVVLWAYHQFTGNRAL